MDRREFITLGTLGGALVLSRCGGGNTEPQPAPAGEPAKPAGAPFTFTMNIIDGYAYLFSPTRLVLGSLDAHGKPHPMLLRVTTGSVKSKSGDVKELPKDPELEGVQFDLTKYHTILEVDGQSGGLKPPKSGAPPTPIACPPPDFDWNNLAFLPHIRDVYSKEGARIRTDWPSKVHSRFVISHGQLSVGRGERGVWHFRKPNEKANRYTQQMTDRVSVDVAGNGTTARLKLFTWDLEEPKGTEPTGVIELTPQSGKLIVDLAIDHHTNRGEEPYADGQPVLHFARYATLLVDANGKDIPEKEAVLPYFDACKDKERCPGEFCPFIQAEIP